MADMMQLKLLRCQKGYFTAAGFARALGMAPHNYGNRERGLVRFSTAEIVRICELLEIPLERGLELMT